MRVHNKHQIIGQVVQTLGDPMRIHGFAVSNNKADLDTVTTVAQAAGFRAYNWQDTDVASMPFDALFAHAIVWGD